MSSRPLAIPTFATDTLYPAGSDPWSGGSTKTAPSAAQQKQGIVPGTRWPAEFENYVKNLTGQWLAHLADLKCQNWQHFDGPHGSGATNWAAYNGVALDSTHQLVIAFGNQDSGALATIATAHTPPMADTLTPWTHGTAAGAHSQSLTWCAVNPVGVSLLGGAGPGWLYRSTDGATWTAIDRSADGADLACGIVAMPSGNFVVGCGSAYVLVSSDNGATWTKHTVHTPGGSTALDAIANDPISGRIAICRTAPSAGHGFPRVAVSDDGGVSWGAWSYPDGSTASETSVAMGYNVLTGQYVMVGDQYCATSPDGVTWTTHACALTLKGPIVFDGPTAVCLWEGANYTGIAYSSDGGVSWSTIALDGSGLTLHGLAHFRNQLWVTGTTSSGPHLFRSLRVGVEQTDGYVI